MRNPGALDCEAVLRMIFDYLDEELEGKEAVRVETHLQHCRSCFSRAEFERRLKTHLAEIGHQQVPVQLEQSVRSLMRRLTGS